MAKNGYIKFDIGIRDYFQSNNTAIVFGRLMYWFSKKPEGFYKFKQRCKKHPLYKEGDSWGEELGMSRKMLDPIFSCLINHHKTKSVYLKSEDRFSGKMFCSYTNHKTNQTYYFVNRKAVDKFLATVSPRKEPPCPKPEVTAPAKQAKTTAIILPSDVPNEQPLACTHPDLPCIQTTTSLSGDVPSSLEPQREEDKLISKKMVDTWNSHMQDTVVWYPSYAARLSKVLSDFFKGCLETFKQYCLSVASADFLTGKAKNSRFKAFLFWAIKPSVIESILAGAYGAKNFFVMSTPEEKEMKADIAHLNNQIKFVEHKIANSDEEIKSAQKKLTDELKDTLSKEEIGNLREESDREFYEKSPPLPGDNERISNSLMNAYFYGFIQRKLKERLGFSENIITPQELLDAKKNLEIERDKRVKELSKLHAEKRNLRGMILSPVLLPKI